LIFALSFLARLPFWRFAILPSLGPRLPAPLAFLPCPLRLGLNAFRCPD